MASICSAAHPQPAAPDTPLSWLSQCDSVAIHTIWPPDPGWQPSAGVLTTHTGINIKEGRSAIDVQGVRRAYTRR